MTDTANTRLLQNLGFAGASGASAGLLLILFVIAGRTLGEVEFGKFSFALALGTIFETLMDFGLHQVAIREVARDKSRAASVLQHTLGIKLLWTSGGLVALLISATLLRHEWDVRMACYLIGGALVARSFMFTIRGVLQGLERFGWDSAVVLGDRVLLLVLGAAVLAVRRRAARPVGRVRGGAGCGARLWRVVDQGPARRRWRCATTATSGASCSAAPCLSVSS